VDPSPVYPLFQYLAIGRIPGIPEIGIFVFCEFMTYLYDPFPQDRSFQGIYIWFYIIAIIEISTRRMKGMIIDEISSQRYTFSSQNK